MSDVFAAVADPTRRHLLERLRVEGPASIARLSEGLPMSRQAVTKHLGVLEAAGLIDKRPEGREMVHALSSDPLRQVSDWLAPYEGAWDERLDRLRAHLSDDPEPTEPDGEDR